MAYSNNLAYHYIMQPNATPLEITRLDLQASRGGGSVAREDSTQGLTSVA